MTDSSDYLDYIDKLKSYGFVESQRPKARPDDVLQITSSIVLIKGDTQVGVSYQENDIPPEIMISVSQITSEKLEWPDSIPKSVPPFTLGKLDRIIGSAPPHFYMSYIITDENSIVEYRKILDNAGFVIIPDYES